MGGDSRAGEREYDEALLQEAKNADTRQTLALLSSRRRRGQSQAVA
jgi:hypothetical protein